MSGHSVITQEADACDYDNLDPEGGVWNGRNIKQAGEGKMQGVTGGSEMIG